MLCPFPRHWVALHKNPLCTKSPLRNIHEKFILS
jgi:hypothetical protein